MRFPVISAALGLFVGLALSGCAGGGGGGGRSNSGGGAGFPRVGLASAPKIVNVSSYDPKERQRPGDSFSEHNVSALRRNGAAGLIARVGKGREQDSKFGAFLGSAHRENLLLGSYYFVLKNVDSVWQADQYLARLRQIARSQAPGQPVLLVGDFDQQSSATDMVRFINRIESVTGVLPVIYLENSTRLRTALSNATPAQKARIRQCPYWIALYSNEYYASPRDLMRAYGVWNDWAMWQYAGVEWNRRARCSVAKPFCNGPWRAPSYFGGMDRPLEHNAFNGSHADLARFWAAHSWVPR
jgi:GH25 family lysozyme M1 (1,4-beta-N-acetylmuramidase)